MRVNVYAEEMTDRIEIISKEIDGKKFTGLRIYLELPVSYYRAPDDFTLTFWGKRDLREVLKIATAALDKHYAQSVRDPSHEYAVDGDD